MKKIFLIATFCTGILSITKEEFVEKMNFYNKNLCQSNELEKKITAKIYGEKVMNIILCSAGKEALIGTNTPSELLCLEILEDLSSQGQIIGPIMENGIKSLLKEREFNEEDIKNLNLNDEDSLTKDEQNKKIYETKESIYDSFNLIYQVLEKKIGENPIAKIISNTQNFIDKLQNLSPYEKNVLSQLHQRFSNQPENMQLQNVCESLYDGIELAADFLNEKTKIEFTKKQSSKTKYIIGGVIVAAIVGAGIYYYYNLKKSQAEF